MIFGKIASHYDKTECHFSAECWKAPGLCWPAWLLQNSTRTSFPRRAGRSWRGASAFQLGYKIAWATRWLRGSLHSSCHRPMVPTSLGAVCVWPCACLGYCEHGGKADRGFFLHLAVRVVFQKYGQTRVHSLKPRNGYSLYGGLLPPPLMWPARLFSWVSVSSCCSNISGAFNPKS